MNIAEQVEALDVKVDYLGFIFYEGSARYCERAPATSKVKRVGVFVNESLETVQEKISEFQLDCVQLHGSESVAYCQELSEKVGVIKAFGISDDFDFDELQGYEDHIKYFLFDTKTSKHGGSGRQFNWEILQNYEGETTFFLSGGIGPDDLENISSISHKRFIGIDLNSRFENKPGDKNIEKLNDFIDEIKARHISAT